MSLDTITRKCVFPYDYVDSFEKLQDVNLPNGKVFYNKLYCMTHTLVMMTINMLI